MIPDNVYHGGPHDGEEIQWQPGFEPAPGVFPHVMGHRDWTGEYVYQAHSNRYEWRQPKRHT